LDPLKEVDQIWIGSAHQPLGFNPFFLFIDLLDPRVFNQYVLETVQCWVPQSRMSPADFRRLVPSLLFESILEADGDPDPIIADYATLA